MPTTELTDDLDLDLYELDPTIFNEPVWDIAELTEPDVDENGVAACVAVIIVKLF
jgi:hypothetical protein